MKNSKATLLITAMLLSAALLGGLIYIAANKLLNQDTAGAACKTTGNHLKVAIKNDAFSDTQISGHLCDTLTITNDDDTVRNIAFGEHENHQPYDGVTEKLLQQGGTLTITLNKTGTYKIHDHLHDEAQASFTVSN